MLVTIARFQFPYQAHIARARLEAEGIAAFVADEHTISMQSLYSEGVRLQVDPRHEEQALHILARDDSAAVDAVADYADGYPGNDADDMLTCPECDGPDLIPWPARARGPLALWWRGVLGGNRRQRWRCRRCGCIFREHPG